MKDEVAHHVSRAWGERSASHLAVADINPAIEHMRRGDLHRAHASLTRAYNRIVRRVQRAEDEIELHSDLMRDGKGRLTRRSRVRREARQS